ncbi:hypothetical protein [Photobacterium sp. OFAV2-7]|uniref:hypothetical protein n=1 Tax=Photobacterium sp. OFAV2-7 TaxID=2917748 RepID=UPI001EF70432|nr:hypothetical protein [Photobacterium sp. OFAV2-7]MCG7588766.1 hypothetical protein [Photobacterium sp. OFAV2-7]
MKSLFAQVDSSYHKALEAFIANGKQRIISNREWCDLTISDFVSSYIEMHNGKLVDSLVKFTLTANCEASNSLLSLMGYQEFAKDALDEWLEENASTIVQHFAQEVKAHEMESAVTAAGF